MDRKNTTDFLSTLLINNKLNQRGSCWAKEVSLDYGTTDVKRVDFMQFIPNNQMSISGIEKGIFVCYEIKSCVADFKSGFGRNFIGEKNYFVMPINTYKQVISDIPYSVGVIVPVPIGIDIKDEFDNPTELSDDNNWVLKVILPSTKTYRKRSMTELLFCMLRSGK